MQSVKIHKNGARKKKSADGVWRSRTFGFPSRSTGEERLHTKLRRIRVISLSAGAIVALFVLGSVAFASYQPRFTIARIDVRGAQAIPAAELMASAQTAINLEPGVLFSEQSTLFFPRRSIEAHIQHTFPRLAAVAVSVDSYPENLIGIDVTERVPFARWCRGTDCFLMDERGFVFAPHVGEQLARAEVFSGGMRIGNPIGQYFIQSYFSRMIALVDATRHLDFEVVSVDVVNDQEYHLELSSGTVLYVRFADDPHTIVENLRAIIASDVLMGKMDHVSYIDLRFDGRAYYKLR